MNKRMHPAELALALLNRSQCSVQVAAVLVDSWGIFAWGINHAGNGFGEHAEAHCLRRANRSRLEGATMFVAARRKRNGRAVTARPCDACQRLVRACHRVIWRDSRGVWCG